MGDNLEEALGLPPSMQQSRQSQSRTSNGPGRQTSPRGGASKTYKFRDSGRKPPKEQSATVNGIPRDQLDSTVAKEMQHLKMFMKEVNFAQ